MAIVGVKQGAGGQDGFQNGFQEVAKTVQDGPRCSQDARKWGKKNVAVAGRFAVFANLDQFRGVVEQKWNK